MSTQPPVINGFSLTCCPWESTQPECGSLEPSNVTFEPPLNVNLRNVDVKLPFGRKGREPTNVPRNSVKGSGHVETPREAA